MNTDTKLPSLYDAKKSEPFEAIATIAGGKAHRVSAQTLLEDCTYERPTYGNRTRTEVAHKGDTLYRYTACGTARHAKWGMVYLNQYRPADAITCTKCLAKEPVAPVKESTPAPRRGSHADCTHPATKAARAACRKENR